MWINFARNRLFLIHPQIFQQDIQTPIRLDHLQVAFRLYGGGVALAAIAFSMEKIGHKILGKEFGGKTLPSNNHLNG